MGFIDVLLIALGLSMDAAAVGMADGMSIKPNWKKALLIALTFGLLQGLFPLASYFAGKLLAAFINKIDHWIALALLLFIGGKMIADAAKKKKEGEDENPPSLTFKLLALQGVSVSIDALAVGVSMVNITFSIFLGVAIITATTFLLTFAGVFIGKKSGTLLSNKAQIIGGVILVAIGLKIFIEHMFF